MPGLRTYLRGAPPQITEGPRPVPTLSSQKLIDEAPVAIGQQPTSTAELHSDKEFRNIEQSIKSVVEALQASVYIPFYTTALLPTVRVGEYRLVYDTTVGSLKIDDGVSAWVPVYTHPNHSGDVTSVGSGATTIGDDKVTYAKMQNVSAASKLIGRGSASGAGDPEEITIGSNLAMTGTTLSATVPSSAPTSASYVTLGTDATLTSERVLTAGNGIGIVDGGAGSTVTVSVAAGCVLQVLQNTYATSASLSTTITLADTTPAITDGTQVLSQAITPASASNKVLVTVNVWGAVGTANSAMIVALFRGSTCINIASHSFATTNFPACVAFTILDAPASTSAQTYTVRVGASSGTCRLNGSNAARQFGGAAASTLTVQEIKG